MLTYTNGRHLWIVLLVALATAPATRAEPAGEVIHRIDFTGQPDGDATGWLKENGYEFKLDADELNPRFENGRLVLETDSETAGLFAREFTLEGVESIRITWGVDRYPQGADWEEGNYRVPIAAMISFGKEKISSGAIYIPNAPYFIGLFLGENEQEGKAYTAKHYNKGGRYYCTPCGAATGETVTTEFNLDEAFQQQFDESPTPPVTSFGLQMNTKDTEGGARAFLETVEFIGG